MLFSCSAARAAEADHFSLREGQIAEITAEVNKLANEGLGKAIEDLNASGGCADTRESEELLYERLTDVFSNHKKGQLVNTIISGDIPRTVIPLKESIYSEWSIWNGFLLGRKGAAKSPLALFPLIKIGDTVVGVDKLEHMFGMGLRYFKKHYLEERPLVSVLKSGIFSEKTFLGGNMLATGVFSYADLSANFNGMRFWNHMLQKRDDVLGAQHNAGPYLACQGGKWVKNEERPIDFRTYVDASMQESMNCSKFATEGGAQKFQAALAAMQTKDKSRIFTCPENPGLMDQTIKKYEVEIAGDSHGSKVDHWIINREGNGRVSYFNEF
ncbi:MAG: hypothetical protein A2X35_12050 [Elusimicrobia bacterium GWA2_61_42]|nr:MAG: hypothetical protein A2X35_12050 [Elusimicrobia bacterium GWA2_61_42]OGR76379.1 MAG: hypothetical protein A2X38_01220 [Elusimicrobia bacterium GWC2_61_25]